MCSKTVSIQVAGDPRSKGNLQSVQTAAKVLRLEAKALEDLAGKLNDSFGRVVDLLHSIPGRVILTGMGKSGHIARKISATLTSTGTPSFFIHPSEASHGDLGMIRRHDAVIALSNSGETVELSSIVEYTRRFSIPLIAITGNSSSSLASQADFLLSIPQCPEACPLGLAPTTSTTMMLALGDALAIAILDIRGFSAQDFKVFHPGGRLGHRLQTVQEIMRVETQVPLVTPDASLAGAILEMTSKGCGCTGVIEESRLVGIITDGDLRRHLDTGILNKTAREIMSLHPKTIKPTALTAEAVAQMNSHSITSLFVMEDGKPVGIVHLHDCLRAGSA